MPDPAPRAPTPREECRVRLIAAEFAIRQAKIIAEVLPDAGTLPHQLADCLEILEQAINPLYDAPAVADAAPEPYRQT